MELRGRIAALSQKKLSWRYAFGGVAIGILLGAGMMASFAYHNASTRVTLETLRAVDRLDNRGTDSRIDLDIEVAGRVIDVASDDTTIFGLYSPDILIEEQFSKETAWASVSFWNGALVSQGDSGDYLNQHVNLRCRGGMSDGKLVDCYVTGHRFESLRPLLD